MPTLPESLHLPTIQDIPVTQDFLIRALKKQWGLNSELSSLTDLDVFAHILQQSNLIPTHNDGEYLRLHISPLSPPEIAIKIFKLSGRLFQDSTSERINQAYQINKHFQNNLEEIVANPNFFFLSHRSTLPSINDLSPEEQHFLYMAYEHAKYIQLYGKFVLPAVFLSFTDQSNAKDLQYCMIQKYIPSGIPISTSTISMLTDNQSQIFHNFIAHVTAVYESTGYYPDPSFLKPNSNNLILTPDDQLLLVDTNHLMHKNQDTENRFISMIETIKGC